MFGVNEINESFDSFNYYAIAFFINRNLIKMHVPLTGFRKSYLGSFNHIKLDNLSIPNTAEELSRVVLLDCSLR